MEFYDFRGTQFAKLTSKDGKPWWVAKELCDYLERGRDTDTAGRVASKRVAFFSYVPCEDII
jgi:prophage antirepressor-like protein